MVWRTGNKAGARTQRVQGQGQHSSREAAGRPEADAEVEVSNPREGANRNKTGIEVVRWATGGSEG